MEIWDNLNMKKKYSDRYPKKWWIATMEMSNGNIIENKYHAPHSSVVRNNLKKMTTLKRIISIRLEDSMLPHSSPHTHHPHLLARNAHEEV